jgi:hypothetical protein
MGETHLHLVFDDALGRPCLSQEHRKVKRWIITKEAVRCHREVISSSAEAVRLDGQPWAVELDASVGSRLESTYKC